jgi:hypothetical protein
MLLKDIIYLYILFPTSIVRCPPRMWRFGCFILLSTLLCSPTEIFCANSILWALLLLAIMSRPPGQGGVGILACHVLRPYRYRDCHCTRNAKEGIWSIYLAGTGEVSGEEHNWWREGNSVGTIFISLWSLATLVRVLAVFLFSFAKNPHSNEENSF